MKKAKEMADFCKKHNFGKSLTENLTLKHFGIIEKHLAPNEDVILCFMGLHNYKSMTSHDNNYAYAITNNRIIMAQKRITGEVSHTVLLNHINDISYKKGIALGIITIDSSKEKFNVALENVNSTKLYNLIQELIIRLKGISQKSSSNDLDQLEKLKTLKDKGVITQREFELKKKQILGI